jgi:hypothetical protein
MRHNGEREFTHAENLCLDTAGKPCLEELHISRRGGLGGGDDDSMTWEVRSIASPGAR